MSQIAVPWTEKTPETLRGYRIKAITMLLGLGLLLLVPLVIALLWVPWSAKVLDDKFVAVVWLGIIGAGGAGVTLMAGGLAVVFYQRIKQFLLMPYVAFLIFCGGVVGVCLITWLFSTIFGFLQSIEAGPDVGNVWLIGVPYTLSAQGICDAMNTGCPMSVVASYALWPLQFEIVRDVVAMVAILIFISLVAVIGIWAERKVSGHMQSRLGPMRVGRWHGWLQSPADGLKLIQKEDLVPPDGDPILFRLATYIVFVPPVCAFIALPFAVGWAFRDMDVAILFILAMLGVEVLGVILAGWASNNKWSVYGAMREACQMVSYEIPLGMSLLVPIMMAGSMRLTDITTVQSAGFHDWLVFANPWCFMAFGIYFTAAIASCKRAPFDLPESESELVAGFLTEYSGIRWSLFFFGEYAAMYVVSGLAVILFLGGWSSPLPASWFAAMNLEPGFFKTLIGGLFFNGPIIFILKASFMFFVQLWVRWTLPRVRIDQVLYACVQVILPLTMAVLLLNTIWILGVDHLQWSWLVTLDSVLHWLLVAIGLLVVAAMLVIAAYGFVNRRRLVGTQAVEAPLPAG